MRLQFAILLWKSFYPTNKQKRDLIEYLATKVSEFNNKDSPKLVIVSAAGKTQSNRNVGLLLDNNHEEADTLMICLGLSATERPC